MLSRMLVHSVGGECCAVLMSQSNLRVEFVWSRRVDVPIQPPVVFVQSKPFYFINILNIVAVLLRKRMQLAVNQIYVVVNRTNIDIITNETK
jgi:hypothetical protein